MLLSMHVIFHHMLLTWLRCGFLLHLVADFMEKDIYIEYLRMLFMFDQ